MEKKAAPLTKQESSVGNQDTDSAPSPSLTSRAEDGRGKTKQLLAHWLELGALSKENEKLRELLYDEITRLPTVSLLLSEIQEMLSNHKRIGILYVDVARESEIERIFGHRVFDQVMSYVGQILEELKGSSFREEDRIAAVMKSGNAFVLLLAPSRDNQAIRMEDLSRVSKRVEEDLNSSFKQAIPSLYKKFHCHIGCAILEDAPNVRAERLVFNALEAAKEDVARRELLEKTREMEKLSLLIRKQQISVLFQPVVRLDSRETVGFEALARGSEEMDSPEKLFRLAIEGNLVWQLERLCREKAFSAARSFRKEHLLFLNISPHSVGDPELRQIADSPLLFYSELKPERIVFEVSERSMISDIDLFKLVLEYFKALGFRIAVDDAGSGYYLGLEIIAKLRPDYVKIDMSLVRQIDQDPVRQELVATIARFASQVNATTIAEGIETPQELQTLKQIGISLGQGYLIGPPKSLSEPQE